MKRLLVVILLSTFSLVFVGGCSQQTGTRDFPPPAGYDSWEEYQEEHDKANQSPTAITPEPASTSSYSGTMVGGLAAERYTDNDHGYTMLYPEDWNLICDDSRNVKIMQPNSTTEIYISAVYATDDPLSEFVTSMRKIYEDDMGYEILVRGEVIDDDLAEGCTDLYTHDYAYAGLPVTYAQETLYMKAKTYSWIIQVNFSYELSDCDIYEDYFYDIVRNFELIHEDEEPLPDIDFSGYEVPLAWSYYGSDWITFTKSKKKDVVQNALDSYEELSTNNTQTVDALVSKLDSVYENGYELDKPIISPLWELIMGE